MGRGNCPGGGGQPSASVLQLQSNYTNYKDNLRLINSYVLAMLCKISLKSPLVFCVNVLSDYEKTFPESEEVIQYISHVEEQSSQNGTDPNDDPKYVDYSYVVLFWLANLQTTIELYEELKKLFNQLGIDSQITKMEIDIKYTIKPTLLPGLDLLFDTEQFTNSSRFYTDDPKVQDVIEYHKQLQNNLAEQKLAEYKQHIDNFLALQLEHTQSINNKVSEIRDIINKQQQILEIR